MPKGVSSSPGFVVLTPVSAAVAVARTSTLLMPIMFARNVLTGPLVVPSNRAVTRTAFGFAKVTDSVWLDEFHWPI